MRDADPQLRDMRPKDAEACAAVAFRAHAAVSAAHNLPTAPMPWRHGQLTAIWAGPY